MSSAVLDASALLALIYQEQGGDIVEQAIERGAAIGTVNVAEVASQLRDAGMPDGAIREALEALDLAVHAFDRPLAYQAGLLRSHTGPAGLSLGDRACLALAAELGLPALTSDRTWAGLAVGITIQVIR
jgi:ribonuclease VapC